MPSQARHEASVPDAEGNQYAHIALGGSGRGHFGDSHYIANTTNNNYYPLRQRRSDETIRYDRRGGRLLEAAKDGQRLRLQYLIQELGVSVDHEDEHGLTALHYAAWSGWADCVVLLINKGAYVNAHSDEYGTPLCLASFMGCSDVVKLLVEDHRANVNADGGRFGSVLHTAVEYPYDDPDEAEWTASLERLLSYGAEVISRKKINFGFWAVARRSLPVTDPASTYSSDELLFEPIHVAANSASLSGLHLLVDNGADINSKAQWLYPRQWTPKTPLEFSCFRDATAPLVLPLLNRGASYHPRSPTLAMHIAARWSLKCLEALLEGGCSPNLVDSNGDTRWCVRLFMATQRALSCCFVIVPMCSCGTKTGKLLWIGHLNLLSRALRYVSVCSRSVKTKHANVVLAWSSNHVGNRTSSSWNWKTP